VSVLLDTHVVLEMIAHGRAADGPWGEEPIHVSVASLWEIAIKVRHGKLATPIPISQLESRFEKLGWFVSPIAASHVTADVDPWPDTNDPFDRLLLAVCKVEGLQLVTRDRKLLGHPLAWPSA